MSATRRRGKGSIGHAFRERPLPGQRVSGDRHVVTSFAGGAVVAAIDGLGHGEEAALASAIAAKALGELAERHDPLALIHSCHERLKSTRGAAMTVARFDLATGAMSWAGVGNVEGLVLRAKHGEPRADEALVTRGGVVGFRLPQLRLSSVDLAAGDTVILMTDGIRPMNDPPSRGAPPAEIADYVFSRYRKDTDDALVVVARYEGSA